MTQRSQEDLLSNISTNIADNVERAISASDVRENMKDVVDTLFYQVEQVQDDVDAVDVHENTISSETYAATIDLDFDDGNVFDFTLTGDATLTVSNVPVGRVFMVIARQGTGGNRLITWFDNLKWASGTEPVLSTTVGDIDTFIFIKTGASEYLGYTLALDMS